MSRRDSQKSKVYRAENAAFAMICAETPVERYPTQAAYKRRVDEIVGSQFFRDAFPHAAQRDVSVRFNPRKRGACAGIEGITTGTNLYVTSELVLIHELTHTVQKREWAWSTPKGERYARFNEAWADPGHGRKYCEIYLRLVARFMGKKAHDSLKLQFKLRKVRFSPKRVGRPLSPERRAELVQRLAAARALRAAA